MQFIFYQTIFKAYNGSSDPKTPKTLAGALQ